MARPAKQKTPPPDRPLTISLNDYLSRQNELATTIRQYQSMSTTLLSFVSQQMNMATTAISALQTTTLTALEVNGIDPNEDGLMAYPAITGLLKMNKADVGNPFTGGYGQNFAAMDLSKIARQAKKQKKPRKPKDPNAPQRPQTAFFLFQMANREKFRAAMQKDNPDVKPGDVQKRLTDTWNNMDVNAQKPYKDQYAEENRKYNEAKVEYEKTTGKDIDDTEVAGDASTPGAPAAQMGAADASGDAESSEEESSEEEESEESSSESEPTPPPQKKKTKKHKEQKQPTPEKKKKRKHAREESEEEATPPKKVKSSKDEKDKKKKKRESNIDPELTRQDKEQRKQKHPEYAPAQPNFGPGAYRMAPTASMGSMGGNIGSLERHMSNNLGNFNQWQSPR